MEIKEHWLVSPINGQKRKTTEGTLRDPNGGIVQNYINWCLGGCIRKD